MPSSETSILSALGLGQPPLATVLLLHALPDGSNHIDWMMARDAKNERPLVSFRLSERLDRLEAGQSLPAQRIQDHRPAYLAYEGEVSGGRGNVKRLSGGTIIQQRESPDAKLHLEVSWDSGDGVSIVQQLTLQQKNPSQWLVNCDSMRRC